MTKIRPEFVERMARRARAEHWRRDLFDARLPQALDELDLRDADEAALAFVAALAELQAGIARLEVLEAHRLELERVHPWMTGQAPTWAWLGPVFILAALVQAFGAVGMVVGVLGLGIVAGAGLAAWAVGQTSRRAALTSVKRLQADELAGLARRATETLGGPLDVRLGDVRYVVDPPAGAEAAAGS